MPGIHKTVQRVRIENFLKFMLIFLSGFWKLFLCIIGDRIKKGGVWERQAHFGRNRERNGLAGSVRPDMDSGADRA